MSKRIGLAVASVLGVLLILAAVLIVSGRALLVAPIA